ncbi:MAG: biopolymer transporter ExbD [Simkaniaceae bacterium]|nr:biopolymer transporter ExbD [Simkaniaceae bacterium]
MSIIPEDKLNAKAVINFAPLVDFLFIVIVVFATLAITKNASHDQTINLLTRKESTSKTQLVESKETKAITLSMTLDGRCTWQDGKGGNILFSPKDFPKLFSKESNIEKVLLHIDKNATWESIANLIFTIRETGLEVYPVYQTENKD